MEFSDNLFFLESLQSTDVDLDPLLWLWCLLVAFVDVVVGALQLRLGAGELIGLVEAVDGDPTESLLLLSPVPPGRP